MTYQPTLKSLNSHPVPDWYDDAKFGIFIHWGLFSIPAFAAKSGSISDAFKNNYDIAVAQTPYCEWYWNAIKVPESDSAKYHAIAYDNAPYEDFRDDFFEGLKQWDPKDWAQSFADAGAKYVVLVTKHHDGFCLWPSAVNNPHQKDWTSQRDIVGELADAVRAKGMRFGVYYSGGIDWTFNREPLRTLGEFISSQPTGDYPAYATAQVRELIDRYKPSVLWNDITWPTDMNGSLKVFADYYNAIPEGVVNDRWLTPLAEIPALRFFRSIIDTIMKAILASRPSKGVIPALPPHCDFRTPEYAAFDKIQDKKWEATRGISHSFGYNRNDMESDYDGVETLIGGFIDTVSKNGNFLLNVGPRGVDAQIPAEQLARLKRFGEWLRANGEGIYGTRPFVRADAQAHDGTAVRFTCRPNADNPDAVFVHLLRQPIGREIFVPGHDLYRFKTATMLSTGEKLGMAPSEHGLHLTWKGDLPHAPAYCIRLT